MDDNGPSLSSNLTDNTSGDESSANNFPIDRWNSETEVDNQQSSSAYVYNQDAPTLVSYSDVIRLEFPKFSKLEESDIEEFLQEYIGEGNFENLKKERFSSQWIVRVKNDEDRQRLHRIWKTKIKNKTCWIKPYYDYELIGFIHWLPHFISDDDVKTQLCQFGEVLFLKSEVHENWHGEIKSEVKYFGLRLRIGMVKNDLPHFLKFSGYRALVIVRGRQPACFHCREYGHNKKDCRTYKEKLKDYCENPAPGNPRTKPRGRRHRPDNVNKHASEDKPQNETNSNSVATIPTEVESGPKRTRSDWKSTDHQKKTEILAILRSLRKWEKKTIDTAKQTLKIIEDNIKMSLTSSEMAESEANEESDEFFNEITEQLADMENITIEMIERTLIVLKNMVTEHFGLDSNASLENLVNNLEKRKKLNVGQNKNIKEE